MKAIDAKDLLGKSADEQDEIITKRACEIMLDDATPEACRQVIGLLVMRLALCKMALIAEQQGVEMLKSTIESKVEQFERDVAAMKARMGGAAQQ